MIGRPVKVRGLALLLSLIAANCSSLFSQNSQVGPAAPSDQVSLSVIVVRTPEEGQEILERLRKGENFAQLARENSIDPTAEAGGYLGKFSPSALRSELRDALRGVGPGQISPVAHIPSGYAILKVADDDRPKTEAPSDRSLPFAATGTVKFSPDVSGLVEAEAALSQFSKPEDWNQSPRTICDMRKQSLAKATASVQAFLAPANEKAIQGRDPFDVMQAHYALAQLYAYQAEMEPAVEQYQEAYRVALAEVPAGVPMMEEALGVIYLHKSEMENEVYHAPGRKCIFPMRPGDAFLKTSDSQNAVKYFLKYLERKPEEIEVKWLLNLAYMTLGEYPAQVPAKYLIPPSTFESREDVGRFVDVAAQAGLDSFSMAGGVIVDDFENNGRFDVVTSSFDSWGSMHFFHNNGDGTFTDQMKKAGLSDQVGGLNILQADYNNDGCTDILVLRGGWELPHLKSLLRNNCNGTFTDVPAASGLAEPATDTQTAVWADIDNDGYLDLFVGNENKPAQLFHNRGDGTFEDISHSAGVDRISITKGVVAADYDNDGYVDFFVSNLNGDNFLYHNNHDKTFTEVAKQAGVQKPWQSFAAWFFDYDNDGWPDLFVTSYYTSVDESVRSYLGLPPNAEKLKLYKNLGNGTFRDVTAEVGLDKVLMPMGANFGDIDNDGFLDMYLGTGNPSYASLLPNVLLHNKEGKFFTDVTASSGTGELHKGHAVAFADIDNDGDEDLLAEIGGAVPGDSHAFRLFENPGNGNDWISLHLRSEE